MARFLSVATPDHHGPGESNPRAPSVSRGEDASSAPRAAPGAARGARGGKPGDEAANGAADGAAGSPVSASGAPGGSEAGDPGLARVAAAWAGLPEAVRRGIAAMVDTAKQADRSDWENGV